MKRKGLYVGLVLVMLMLVPFVASAKITGMKISPTKATLRVGKSATVALKVAPASQKGNVRWSSSDETIATVNSAGRVTAVKPGKAIITVTASDEGGLSRRMQLTVKPAVITRVSLSRTTLSAKEGDAPVALTASVAPAAATADQLTYKTSNKKVATVSKAGVVTFVGAGKATITAVAPSGKKASCAVTVTSTQVRRRAIVIGEARARSERAFSMSALPMVPNEVKNISAMFRSNGITTTSVLNGSESGVINAIKSAFQGATANDVSYVYIICHGGMVSGGYRLFLCGDGNGVKPSELRKLLDQVPGKVVVMLGACYSGRIINKSAEEAQADEAQAFLDDFLAGGLTTKGGEFIGSKYYVLCAASGSQEGYGVVTRTSSGALVAGDSYNFFGKAVLDGGGGAADLDGDKQITLAELYSYTHAQVKSLYAFWQNRIGLSAYSTQTVVVYPSGSNFVVF